MFVVLLIFNRLKILICVVRWSRLRLKEIRALSHLVDPSRERLFPEYAIRHCRTVINYADPSYCQMLCMSEHQAAILVWPFCSPSLNFTASITCAFQSECFMVASTCWNRTRSLQEGIKNLSRHSIGTV